VIPKLCCTQPALLLAARLPLDGVAAFVDAALLTPLCTIGGGLFAQPPCISINASLLAFVCPGGVARLHNVPRLGCWLWPILLRSGLLGILVWLSGAFASEDA
jgi:hypothetical protein